MWGKRTLSNEALPVDLTEEATRLNDLHLPALSDYGSTNTINTVGQRAPNTNNDESDEGNASIKSDDEE